MVNITKSGEEGYYPDLQKTAEERLRSLSPNNRQLRVEEPVLTRSSMNSDEWNNIVSDVSSWKKDISMRDRRLTEENNNTVEELDVPPIRQPPPSNCITDKKAPGSTVRANRVSDYAVWDKYDVDTELLKMDLEQEKEQEEHERQREEKQRKQAETNRLDLVVMEAEKLSETERQVLAEQEKNRGNEYYQAKEFNEASKYYTASIAIWPTPKAYNNRAACYLKQCMYSAALDDANCTLQLEPDNVKALFRRGIALQHKNMFREALADMTAVLRREPKHLLAQHISKELREQILTLPKTVRIMCDEGFNKPKKIVEMSAKSAAKENLPGTSYEVNEWGLPKVMCQCNVSPRFLASRKCPTASPQPRMLPVINNARIVELSDEYEPPKTSTKLEIVEVEEPQQTRSHEDFYIPVKKCVVDKRTVTLTNGETSRKLSSEDAGTSLPNGDCNTNLTNSDSRMEKDFELKCSISSKSPEPVAEPST